MERETFADREDEESDEGEVDEVGPSGRVEGE
jgi:hypothetical protein